MIHVVALDAACRDPPAAAVFVIALHRHDEIAALVLLEGHAVPPRVRIILYIRFLWVVARRANGKLLCGDTPDLSSHNIDCIWSNPGGQREGHKSEFEAPLAQRQRRAMNQDISLPERQPSFFVTGIG